MKRRYHKEPELKRTQRKVISFNTKELSAIDNYCSKYKIDNRTQFMRETIISSILKRFSDDYPSLWDQPQLSLFASR